MLVNEKKGFVIRVFFLSLSDEGPSGCIAEIGKLADRQALSSSPTTEFQGIKGSKIQDLNLA
jgi:hypothetical protein